MKTQRFAAVTMGIMVLSVGLLFTAGCGNGDDSAIAQQGASTQTDLSGVSQNWDKNLPAAQRFVVLAAFNSDAIRDNETGLVWERAPGTGFVVWNNASCNNNTVGGRAGWRLPSLPELTSLIDPSVGSSAPLILPADHPFSISPGHEMIWSREPDLNDPTRAFAVIFGGNAPARGAGTAPKNQGSVGVWCVRGGINANSR